MLFSNLSDRSKAINGIQDYFTVRKPTRCLRWWLKGASHPHKVKNMFREKTTTEMIYGVSTCTDNTCKQSDPHQRSCDNLESVIEHIKWPSGHQLLLHWHLFYSLNYIVCIQYYHKPCRTGAGPVRFTRFTPSKVKIRVKFAGFQWVLRPKLGSKCQVGGSESVSGELRIRETLIRRSCYKYSRAIACWILSKKDKI